MSHHRYLIMTVLLAFTTALSFAVINTGEIRIKDVDLSKIPYNIGGWTGADAEVTDVPDLAKRIHATNIFYRNYKKAGGEQITVYVAHCKSLKYCPDFKFHFPKYCYIGSGWTIVYEADEIIAGGGNRGQPYRARKLLLQKGEERLASYFYFQTRRNVKLTPGIRQRVVDLVNRLIFRRSDITVVRISANISGNNADEAIIQLKDFVKVFEPELTKLLEELG